MTLANRPTLLAWQPITTHRPSMLSIRVHRIDRWTFRVTGQVSPVSERWQRIVVVGVMGIRDQDVSRHEILTKQRGYTTWLPDVHPNRRGSCTAQVRFLGGAVSLPVTKRKRFAC
jgi:hypothetical protein